MTSGQFWAEVKALGITLCPGAETKRTLYGRDREGTIQCIPKPELLTPEDRENELRELRKRVQRFGEPN